MTNRAKNITRAAVAAAIWLLAVMALTAPCGPAHAAQTGTGDTEVYVDVSRYGETANQVYTASVSGALPKTGDAIDWAPLAVVAAAALAMAALAAICIAAKRASAEGGEDESLDESNR